MELNMPIIMSEDEVKKQINREIKLLEDKLNTELEVEERIVIMFILKRLKEEL